MNVAVTGAAGFIGRHVTRVARERGHEVVELRHRWSSEAELEERLGRVDLDRAIHLGWYARPSDYLWNARANALSILSTLQLAAVLARRGVPHLLAAGSCLEYAEKHESIRESDAVVPNTPYGAAKAFAHVLLEQQLGDVCALAWTRPFYVVGPGQPAGRIYRRVARALLVGDSIELSDGRQVRDFVDVRDVADAMVGLSERGATGTYNICTGAGVALRELFSSMAAYAHADPGLLRFNVIARRAQDHESIVGDPGRLDGVLGSTGRRSFAEIVAGIVDDVRDQDSDDG